MSQDFNQGGAPPISPVGGPPTSQPPKNYLVESILLFVCCAGPLAIPAIIYAAQVNGKAQSGDFQGAEAASNSAKMWCLIGLGIGLLCNVDGGLLWTLGAAASISAQ